MERWAIQLQPYFKIMFSPEKERLEINEQSSHSKKSGKQQKKNRVEGHKEKRDQTIKCKTYNKEGQRNRKPVFEKTQNINNTSQNRSAGTKQGKIKSTEQERQVIPLVITKNKRLLRKTTCQSTRNTWIKCHLIFKKRQKVDLGESAL